MHPTSEVYGYGHIWGGATGSHVTGSDVGHVTWSDVSHMTRSDPVRKYVLRMCNRKLRNIRPSRAFWPEVTKARDRKRLCPEVVLTGSRFCACPAFSRVFFLVVVSWVRIWPKVTWPLSGFPWVYATGSCATSVVTEGHVTPLEVSMGCSLRRPRPITLGNPVSYI
jgi:hypothetical protein